MGYDRLDITIYGQLDSHGGKDERADALAWNAFVAEVRALAEQPRYRDIIGADRVEADEAWVPGEDNGE